MEKLRIWITASVFVFSLMSTAFAQGTTDSLRQQAVKGTLRPATINVASGGTVLTKRAPFFSGGLLAAVSGATDAVGASAADGPRSPGLGLSSGTVGCGERDLNHNTRVNQDCTFRFQAEEGIVFNPADRKQSACRHE